MPSGEEKLWILTLVSIFGISNKMMNSIANVESMLNFDLNTAPMIWSRYDLPDIYLCDSRRLFQSPKTVIDISRKANVLRMQ